MKILIDIKHPAQLNLFKNLARDLTNEGWDVTISYLDRGKLPGIIEREYQGFKKIMVGRSRGSKWSIIWEGNVTRIFDFLKLITRERYNIVIAASSLPLAFAAYVSQTPVIQFYDDPERKNINRFNALLSNKLFYPPIVEKTKKIGLFNCLKEWSYLSPRRFRPDPSVLNEYGLEEHKYIFVREVSNKSFNYFDQSPFVIAEFANDISKKHKIVLSLEDKSIKDRFPKDWIILQEPVSDIHSLIYYSKLVISSGDSMAREGGMLGIPAVYCGFRDMKANEILMKEGILQHLPGRKSLPVINNLVEGSFSAEGQENLRSRLASNWDDMVLFMKSRINEYKRTTK
jgi:predicted glycosyltransferase